MNKPAVRVAVIADQHSITVHSASIRHMFVGLTSESVGTALICRLGPIANAVISPLAQIIDYPVFRSPLFWFQNRRAVIGNLEKFKPTVIHCLSPERSRLGRYLAERLDIPYVVSFNSPGKEIAKAKVSRKHCGALIASSERICHRLKRRFSRLADRALQINPGTFVEDSCSCFCQPPHVASVIVACELEKFSDFQPLLNAVRHLAIDGYDFIVVIVGTGKAAGQIHECVKKLGISQIVNIVGQIRPLRSVFSSADIFVQPKTEGHTNSYLLEAMGVGMAVASCHDQSNEMLKDNQTAVLFDVDDELSIYTALQKLFDKHEYARQIAMAAQSYLREHHSVSKMTSSLIEVYRSSQQWYQKENKSPHAPE